MAKRREKTSGPSRQLLIEHMRANVERWPDARRFPRLLKALDAGEAVTFYESDLPMSIDLPYDTYLRLGTDGSLKVVTHAELTDADMRYLDVMAMTGTLRTSA